jgi:integrase
MNEEEEKKKYRRRRWKRGGGAVRKMGRVFYIRYCVGKRRIDEKTDASTESEARKLLNERLGDVSKGVTPAAASKTKLRELYEDMRADYRNRGQRLDVLDSRWKHLEPAFGEELVATITSPRIQRYIDVRRKEKAADATVQREIAALRRMLRLGYATRKVGQLPYFPTIRVENARMVFFDDDEFDRLLTAIPETIERDVGNDWLVPFVIVARWIGTRRNELVNLERRQVDLEVGKITLDPGSTKNGEGRVIYLPPEALQALRAWDEQTRAFERDHGVIVRRVFHRHGKPIRHFPYDLFRAACMKAEIGGRRILHDFRRTAARSYRRAGVSEGVVMMVGGWKTRSIFERYNIKSEDDLREAAEMVGASGNGKKWESRANTTPIGQARTKTNGS